MPISCKFYRNSQLVEYICRSIFVLIKCVLRYHIPISCSQINWFNQCLAYPNFYFTSDIFYCFIVQVSWNVSPLNCHFLIILKNIV